MKEVKEEKKLKNYDPPTINKWIIWVIAITSFLSIFTPVIGIIPVCLSLYIIFKFRIVPQKYVSEYISLAKIKARLNQQQLENERLHFEKLDLEQDIEAQRKFAYLEIEADKKEKLEKNTEQKQQLLNDIDNLESNIEEYKKMIKQKEEELSIVEKSLVDKLEIYNFKQLYPIDIETFTSSDIKNQLSLLTIKEKELFNVSNILSSDDVNNKSHVNNQKKQLLRMFNVECNYYYSKVNANNFDQIHSNIIKSFETLNRLFKTDKVTLEKKHLKIKLEKLNLIHQHALKLEQERELRKEEKAILREQLAAERELEQKRKIIEKDEKHFNNEIKKLMKYMQQANENLEKQLYIEKIKELEEKLKIVEKDKENIEFKIAHAKAGYVYIISNIGSFGENIYKIGVTRRENPLDRIKDLGDASVPFSFDVHALIFSEDAFKLEKILHDHFRKKEVNKVNHRKEFFKVDLEEVKELVLKEYNNTVNFEFEAKAEQYRESLRLAQILD